MDIDTYLGHRVAWRYWLVGPNLTLRSCFMGFPENSMGYWKAVEWPICAAMLTKCFLKCDPTPALMCVYCGRQLGEEAKECPPECPRKEGKCGIYAFDSLESLRKNAENHSGAIFGTVSLWGGVVENEDPEDKDTVILRGRYAYPEKLCGASCRKCKRAFGIDSLFVVGKPSYQEFIKQEKSFFGRMARIVAWFWQYDVCNDVTLAPFFVCEKDSMRYRQKGYTISAARPLLQKVAEKYSIEIG